MSRVGRIYPRMGPYLLANEIMDQPGACLVNSDPDLNLLSIQGLSQMRLPSQFTKPLSCVPAAEHVHCRQLGLTHSPPR
jgi:hypothetical protein